MTASRLLLLQPTGGVQVATPVSAISFNQLVVGGGPPSPNVTFGSAPAVGDYLVAMTMQLAGGSWAAGWTQFGSVANCQGAGGNPTLMAYHQVGPSEGSTFTPYTFSTANNAIAVADIGARGASWSQLQGTIYSACADTGATQTATVTTGPLLKGVTLLAVGLVSAGVVTPVATLTGITGDAQSGLFGSGPNASTAAAYASVTADGQTVSGTLTGFTNNVNAQTLLAIIVLNPVP